MRRKMLFSVIFSVLPVLPVLPAAGVTHVELLSPDLERRAKEIPVGESFFLEGLSLGDELGLAALELSRFEIFAPDSEIVISGDDGVTRHPAPDNAYFHGSIVGDPSSWAAFTVREAGGARGLIARRGQYWILANEGAGEAPVLQEIDADSQFASQLAGFSCGSERLETAGNALEELFAGVSPTSLEASRGAAAGAGASAGGSYTARIAVETDWEFYQRFGNSQDATDYIGDLFAYLSTIYATEVDTTLALGTVFLYTSSSDPWQQTSTGCGMMEMGGYWNANRSGEDRTIAHFLSGKSTGGGIAWVGVLCSGGFSVSLSASGFSCPGMPDTGLYGGGYGFSGSISGSFNPGNPGIVWDIYVVSHEIGHNFNSPHSHCYEGLGGNSAAVDRCFAGQCGRSGCVCGGTSLPCSTQGAGCGTIMSYCHLLGGLSNVSMTFGLGHAWGVEPERVPARMNAHVVSRAAGNPSCLAFIPPANAIFTDGFESGNTSAWTQVLP